MNYQEGCPVFEEFLQRILNEKLPLKGYAGSGLIEQENPGLMVRASMVRLAFMKQVR